MMNAALVLLFSSLLFAGSSPAAAAAECNAAPGAGKPQFIIGYGSLMQEESRKRTSPNAGPAQPVEVSGYRRGWFSRGQPVGFSTTYLGVVPDKQARLNAVAYQLDAGEILATDRREASYCRLAVAIADIKPLAPGKALPEDAQAWIYVSRPQSVASPDPSHPIAQSYVDIFLSGCLEQEERFGLLEFSAQCLATTTGWSEHWVNDRIYPRRPFIHQPKAWQIDQLLSTGLPRYFPLIRIDSGQSAGRL